MSKIVLSGSSLAVAQRHVYVVDSCFKVEYSGDRTPQLPRSDVVRPGAISNGSSNFKVRLRFF